MGIPIDGPSWMFGDNQSVITFSIIPHSNPNKRHNALSYHRVREAISAGILYFIHIDGKLNPSDVLTKFLAWAKFWPLIQPMLFWKGDTIRYIHANLPVTQIIEEIKLAASSGLRGVSTINPSDAIGGSNDGERVQHVTEVIVIPKGILNTPKKSRHTIVEDHDPNGNTARRVCFEGNLHSGY
jgi:hypothetical protein